MKKLILLAGLVVAFALPAMAKDCSQTIDGTDQMSYSLKEIKVPAGCTMLKLTLKHVGKSPKAAMGHNWVLAETKDMEAIVQAGAKAGAAADYLDTKAPGLIAHTKLVGGGESATTTVDLSKLKKGGDYSFFCTFPGHAALMKGKFGY